MQHRDEDVNLVVALLDDELEPLHLRPQLLARLPRRDAFNHAAALEHNLAEYFNRSLDLEHRRAELERRLLVRGW